MVASSSNFYQIGASLPVDAKSYVQREADEEFYQKLRSGKFCYVLNSRQMGKSSLRVQTMQRLQLEGTVCATIDLTGIGKHKVTLSQWYGGIVYGLVESCQLEDKFDFDWQTWWQKKQSILDPVSCLRLFIEQVLLEKIQQPIVIFVDEIDRVISQDFSLDDFFALIRFFQNQRVNNSIFERLTFALLGVATPSDLITDKTQTPFNIGEGIELHGFRLKEVQPLINGLQGKVSNPQQVMEQILDWTGGQPFLTQKLCQFMVEESEKDNPRSVEEVVESRIIENWESQDDPEHLRTIRDRILSNEQRASYLLELYQRIRQEGEITSNNSIEFSELQLSGLVVKRKNKLIVSNRIYQQIFNQNWLETQLKNLRPYSESFRFWMASGGEDKSRLLRGKALQDAREWARDKDISYQDKQYLAASDAKEIQEGIAAQKQEAALLKEKEDREAAEERTHLLSQANKKAQRTISIGIVILFIATLGALALGIASRNKIEALKIANEKMQETQTEVTNVRQLVKLAGDLQTQNLSDADEALRLAALSFNIDNHQLKTALLFSAKSQVYQHLKKWNEAKDEIQKSKEILVDLEKKDKNSLGSEQGLLKQIQLLLYENNGSLLAHNKESRQQAIESYKTAFKIYNNNPTEIDFTKDQQLITAKNIEFIHQSLIDPFSEKSKTLKGKSDLIKQVKKSVIQDLFAQLEYFLKAKNWLVADRKTDILILYIAKREKQMELDPNSIKNFYCPDLRKIDQLWVVNSDNRFGFSVQKKIWIMTGNRQGIRPDDWNEKDHQNYLKFAKAVGWYDDKEVDKPENYDELMKRIKDDNSYGQKKGSLPTGAWSYDHDLILPGNWGGAVLLSLDRKCNI